MPDPFQEADQGAMELMDKAAASEPAPEPETTEPSQPTSNETLPGSEGDSSESTKEPEPQVSDDNQSSESLEGDSNASKTFEFQGQQLNEQEHDYLLQAGLEYLRYINQLQAQQREGQTPPRQRGDTNAQTREGQALQSQEGQALQSQEGPTGDEGQGVQAQSDPRETQLRQLQEELNELKGWKSRQEAQSRDMQRKQAAEQVTRDAEEALSADSWFKSLAKDSPTARNLKKLTLLKQYENPRLSAQEAAKQTLSEFREATSNSTLEAVQGAVENAKVKPPASGGKAAPKGPRKFSSKEVFASGVTDFDRMIEESLSS